MTTGQSPTVPISISWYRPPVLEQGSAVSGFSTISDDSMQRFAEGKSFIVTTMDNDVKFFEGNQPLGDKLTVALSVLESGDYTAYCQLPNGRTVDFRLAIRWNDRLVIENPKPFIIESDVVSLRFDVGVATDPYSVHPKMSGELADGKTFGHERENIKALLPKSRSRRTAEGECFCVIL